MIPQFQEINITVIGRHGKPDVELTHLVGNSYRLDLFIKEGQPCE